MHLSDSLLSILSEPSKTDIETLVYTVSIRTTVDITPGKRAKVTKIHFSAKKQTVVVDLPTIEKNSKTSATFELPKGKYGLIWVTALLEPQFKYDTGTCTLNYHVSRLIET